MWFAKERCRRGVLGIDNEAVEEPADDVGGVREVKIDARQGSHPGPPPRLDRRPGWTAVAATAAPPDTVIIPMPRAIPAAAVSRNWRWLGEWVMGRAP